MTGYSAADREAIIELLRSKKIEPDKLNWDMLEDLAAEYQMRRDKTAPRRALIAQARKVAKQLRSTAVRAKPGIIAGMDAQIYLSTISRIKLLPRLYGARFKNLYFEQENAAALAITSLPFLANFEDALDATIAKWTAGLLQVKRRGPMRNLGLRWFARLLGLLYFEAFGKQPRYSTVNSEDPAKRRYGGPFHDFVELCVRPLDPDGKPTSRSAIGRAVRDAVAWFKSEQKK